MKDVVREAVRRPVEPARTGGVRRDGRAGAKGRVNGSAHGDVRGDVRGGVHGDVRGGVHGDVRGGAKGRVRGDVHGGVNGSVNGTRGRPPPVGVSLLRPAPEPPRTAPHPPGIKSWPEPDRPREKLLRRGPAALSDAELVALFVRSGTKGRNAVEVAREGLAAAGGGLRGLLDLDREELCRLAGFGPARYAELQACLELGRRYLAAPLGRGKPLESTDATSRFLMAKLRRHPFEVFACLFLDAGHRVIEFEEMFRGTLDTTSVHSREVVRRCLDLNAGAVIFVHNHPSGSAEPSAADRALTDKLVSALLLVKVKVLDHLVIGDAEYYSFADHGLV